MTFLDMLAQHGELSCLSKFHLLMYLQNTSLFLNFLSQHQSHPHALIYQADILSKAYWSTGSFGCNSIQSRFNSGDIGFSGNPTTRLLPLRQHGVRPVMPSEPQLQPFEPGNNHYLMRIIHTHLRPCQAAETLIKMQQGRSASPHAMVSILMI